MLIVHIPKNRVLDDRTTRLVYFKVSFSDEQIIHIFFPRWTMHEVCNRSWVNADEEESDITSEHVSRPHSLSVFSPPAEMSSSSSSTASTQSCYVFPVRRAPGLRVLLGLCDPRTCPTSGHAAPWCWQELPSVQQRLGATAIDHTDKQANVAAGVQRRSATELRPAGSLPSAPLTASWANGDTHPHPTPLQLCVQFTTKIYLF